MNEWGNNPATYEALGSILSGIGVIAVFLSTLLAWRALRETKEQRQAFEREAAVRMRPWVGLFGCTFIPSNASEDVLELTLRNFGPLPAQRANLSLVLKPLKPIENEPENPINRQEQGAKALLPGEEGRYTVRLAQYPQFSIWRRARRNVHIEGVFLYAVDQLEFRTEIEATLWFSECSPADDAKVRLNWRNKHAS